jgi:hypothetical protein
VPKTNVAIMGADEEREKPDVFPRPCIFKNKLLSEKGNTPNINNNFFLIFFYSEYIRAISKCSLKRLTLQFVSQFSGAPTPGQKIKKSW